MAEVPSAFKQKVTGEMDLTFFTDGRALYIAALACAIRYFMAAMRNE